MLQDLNPLTGSSLIATDGELGTVRNFLFDDQSWLIRYLVVEVGNWFKPQEVVIPITAVDQPDLTTKTLTVRLTVPLQTQSLPLLQQPQKTEHEYALYFLDPSSFEERPQLTRASWPPFASRERGLPLHGSSQPPSLSKHLGRALT
jgi:hypothetical protein